MSFVGPAFDCYSVSVPAIIYAISYYLGPRYNGIRLYDVTFRLSNTNKTFDNRNCNASIYLFRIWLGACYATSHYL